MLANVYKLLFLIIIFKSTICVASEGEVCIPRQLKYHTKPDNSAHPTLHTYNYMSKLVCALECSEEPFCTAFSFTEQSRVCKTYGIDIEDLDSQRYEIGTNLYLWSQRCGHLPSVPNASPPTVQSSNGYPAGKRVGYSCVEGAHMVGNGESLCLSNGTWFMSSVKCVFVKTCHEADMLGINISPPIAIRPIDNGAVAYVICERRQDGVYTVIGHNLANRTHITGHETDFSGVFPIEYTVPLELAIGVADISAECEQFIKFECLRSGAHYNSFRTRTGEQADYFAGGVKGQGDNNCACKINNACIGQEICNCNADVGEWKDDTGYNQYKEDLPITAFLGGDTGGSDEEAKITIGSLKCKG
ncbi:hypothetical protein SNE40_008142 [Patella caerulea]|uniref:Sushi domain-containing protein n=1 Tax=Patella caerulea TaxID=87958 RepID=A0AAN8PUR3_PATCE